jgi:phosphate acyltransferase
MKIGLDAMGGDRAPEAPVLGALMAIEQYGYDMVLIGREDVIRAELEKHKYPKGKIEIIDVSQTIEMNEPAALSVRKKRDSSIVVGADLLKRKKFDAFVSAGNTGAVVCAATLSLRLLPGVDRPGIAVIFPTLDRPCLVIDVGANIDPKPLHLLQYGIMGDAYSKHILFKDNPTVGLLNIGEEATKGTDNIKEAHTMLNDSELNFVGNVEPKEIYRGKVDIVVCDGFVGNVFLKVTEGVVEAASQLLKRELKQSSLATKLGALLTLPAFKKIKMRMDATEYGGAPLMGVDGSVIIAHGISNAKAMKNAIRAAGENIAHKVNTHVVEELRDF